VPVKLILGVKLTRLLFSTSPKLYPHETPETLNVFNKKNSVFEFYCIDKWGRMQSENDTKFRAGGMARNRASPPTPVAVMQTAEQTEQLDCLQNTTIAEFQHSSAATDKAVAV
jgi:hypothetical protein